MTANETHSGTNRDDSALLPEDDAELLIVEDDANDMKLALYSLQQNDIAQHIQLLRSGEELLDYVFCRGRHAGRDIEHQPRLVLLDLTLPGMNGKEILRRLKGDPRTARVPVVVLTNSESKLDMVECYGLGANGFVVKPLDFDAFVAAFRQLGAYWLTVNRTP
jgi:two-component system response regulator